MVKVCLRWCMSGIHSGHPYVFDVPETTTIGEVCEMVMARNNEWWCQNWVGHQFRTVKVCGPNDAFLGESQTIGGGHYNNECYLTFDAV